MKIGDKVVYIMESLPDIGLVHNRIYEIFSTESCGGCKDDLHIDVGIETDATFIFCSSCANIINIDKRYLFHHSGFRELDEVECMELEEAASLIF